jgi:hypothetical protein
LIPSLEKTMSYLEDLDPRAAIQALGLQREHHTAMDLALPVLTAFVLGAGVGAGVALLLAPTSGRELRTDLSRKANELKDDLAQKATELQENVRKALPPKQEAAGFTPPASRTITQS